MFPVLSEEAAAMPDDLQRLGEVLREVKSSVREAETTCFVAFHRGTGVSRWCHFFFLLSFAL